MLFIGIAYIAHRVGAEPFLAQPPPTVHQASDYVYLSFVTLTTVGFGDITPLSNLARSVVVLEALIGQIFLVTLVARLVSLYRREHSSSPIISRDRTGGRRHRGGTADDLVLDPEGAGPVEPE